MTNEDVLERAAKYDAYRAGGERDDPSTERLIDALAAEVRELRRILREVREVVAREDIDGNAADAVTVRMVLLKEIDAAMASRGEDA